MKLHRFISLHAVLLFLFGAGFLIAPHGMLALYSASTDAIGILTARVFGISNIQLSIMMWLVHKDIGSRIINYMVWLLFLGSSLAFVLALQAQLAGLFNPLGWSNTGLYFLFSVGYGIYVLKSIGAIQTK